jgi:alpha-ketoglutarate-dependent taurine dioxygenase
MSIAVERDLEVRPLTASIGAEVRGVDLSQPLGTETVNRIRDVWHRHHVVFFPDQHIGPDEQVAFARYFGEVTQPSAYLPPIDDDHKEVVAFDSRTFRDEHRPIGRHRGWHADVTFQRTPPLGAVFRVVTLPSVGGTTLFASTVASYATLSEPIQRLLDGLVAVHRVERGSNYEAPQEGPEEWEGEPVDGSGAEHPVVAVHPETGRKALFVNPQLTDHIKGVSAEESAALLDLVYDHTLRPENVIRYHWSEGAVGMWDNRAVWHRRADDFDPGETRIVHRVQLKGGVPVGPTSQP